MKTCEPADTLMVEKSKLDEDPQRKAVDPIHYRGMIGTLMYLTANRPDLVFAVCMCARYHFIKEQVENEVLNCISSEQNISWQISLPMHWDENDLTFLSTSLAREVNQKNLNDTKR
ncbi:hypothetical protein Tco_1572650 [Tanacetum coccineum]